MRMICPNCGAQYEVDADVIPESGRDVQCSNCGHTWFQKHAEQEVEQEQSQPVEPPTEEVGEIAEAGQDVLPEEPAATPPQQQKLDEGVADILREEAQRETAERSSETGGLESQPDLGLGQTAENAEETDTNLHSGAEALAGVTATQDNSRRDLLPDIEEINSTLAATSEKAEESREDDELSPEIKRRDGFRRGFYAALFVFAIMALVYVFSPNIATAFPKLAPTLASYVDWVNTLRTSVDRVLLSGVDKITALLAQLSGDQGG